MLALLSLIACGIFMSLTTYLYFKSKHVEVRYSEFFHKLNEAINGKNIQEKFLKQEISTLRRCQNCGKDGSLKHMRTSMTLLCTSCDNTQEAITADMMNIDYIIDGIKQIEDIVRGNDKIFDVSKMPNVIKELTECREKIKEGL